MTRKVIHITSFLIVSTLLTCFSSCNTDEQQTVATMNNLVMSDEFDTDGTPNSSLWTYDIGRGSSGWGNNELQYYTNRPENVKVEDGNLVITARQESYQGAAYTSARLKTQGLFETTHGRFEARIKLPYGQGYWPAFWLLGANITEVSWPACGEIDVMEYRGQEPTIVHGTIHGPQYFAGQGIGKSYTLNNSRFDTDFHIFGIEWTSSHINYYVDGDLYQQITKEEVLEKGDWVFDHPFFIILNLAVGGNYVGPPNGETTFPQEMLVDYVRVYQ